MGIFTTSFSAMIPNTSWWIQSTYPGSPINAITLEQDEDVEGLIAAVTFHHVNFENTCESPTGGFTLYVHSSEDTEITLKLYKLGSDNYCFSGTGSFVMNYELACAGIGNKCLKKGFTYTFNVPIKNGYTEEYIYTTITVNII